MPDWLAILVYSGLRFFPFPTRPGLRVVGRPGPHSPVLVTCNFDLTVRRVMRALRGLDCYVLVCHSRGINVWCAASAGHFSAHSVISELKRSELDRLVAHRCLILPQFSAPGIDTARIARETGWTSEFGPAYARDIPAYLAAGHRATPQMRLARFPLADRLEMAAMWGFPLSMIALAILLIADQGILIPGAVALIWGVALTTFVSFEYLGRIRWLPTGLHKMLLVDVTVTLVIVLWGLGAGDWPASRFLSWSATALGLSLMLGMDFEGQSPYLPAAFLTYWGRRFPGILRSLSAIGFDLGNYFTLDVVQTRCTGCGRCLDVCPKPVYSTDVSRGRRVSRLENPAECELCAACVRQCPTGAIVADPPVRRFSSAHDAAGERMQPTAGGKQ